jgi:hypothetical protein
MISAQLSGSLAADHGERGADRDRHADHAEEIALARRGRARQPAQREDEEHAGDEIEQRDDIRVHHGAHFFFLYIASMRWVTRKPPKMFTLANDQRDEAEGARPPAPGIARSGTPTASSAPTTITEEIALVTLISGVCSAGVTDHTTK